MPSISVTKLFDFNHMKVTFSEAAEYKTFNFAGVVLVSDDRYKPVCSSCGQKVSSIYQTRNRIVRDLPLGRFKKPYISFTYRLVECPHCQGIYTEGNSVAAVGGPRVTLRLAQYIKDLCQFMTIEEVADLLEIDWKTVKAIDMNALSQEFIKTDYTGLRLLTIDEFAYARYHRYLTIVVEYETGRVVWIGEGRSKETLLEFFRQIPDEIKTRIEAVAMDMW